MALRNLATAAAAALLLSATAVSATTLTFQQTAGTSQNPIDPAYGDNVTGASNTAGTYGTLGGPTPNVTVNYPTANTYVYNQYADLPLSIYNQANGSSLSVQLVADPGFNVLLSGFDLGAYNGFGIKYTTTVPSVTVTDGSAGILFQQSSVAVEGGPGSQHTSIDFSTALTASILNITLDFTGFTGPTSYIGLSNITFGQAASVVPLPGAAWLFLTGLGGLGVMVRRRGRPSVHG